MDDEQLKALAEKVVSGEASKEEQVKFMEGFNALLEQLKDELKK